MPLTNPTALARGILDEMETAFATKNPALIKGMFAEDVVFLGSAATCLGKVHADAYIDASVAHIDAMAWDHDQVWTFPTTSETLAMVALGAMHLPDGRQPPYRLSLVLRVDETGWEIVHFHGSTVPP